MDDAREEMRKLIDVIEKGAKSTSVEQAGMTSNFLQTLQAFLRML